jgi:hypothetical protein
VDFDVIDQLLIRYLHSSDTGEKMECNWILRKSVTH